MTPIYLKILSWLLFGLTALAALILWTRITLRLRAAYPFTDPPKLPFSRSDLPFGLEIAKATLKQIQLKQLRGQINLAGRPDLAAVYGGAISAALHSLAAAANCRDVDVQIKLLAQAEKNSAQISAKISIPLWFLIALTWRTAAYLWQRRRKLRAKITD